MSKPSFKSIIEQRVTDYPLILEATTEEQFQELVSKAPKTRMVGSHTADMENYEGLPSQVG